MLWLMMLKLFATNTAKLMLERGCFLQGEAPIANAETVLTEHKASMWQAAHWVLKPMWQVHLLSCFHGRPSQKETCLEAYC